MFFKVNIMYLDAAKKQEIFGKYGKSNTDTGSAEAQIALFSYHISHLTEHLKLNRKDYSTERALAPWLPFPLPAGAGRNRRWKCPVP